MIFVSLQRSEMIEITDKAIAPESVIAKAKTNGSGCVVTYVGVIRNLSEGKSVLSVEYQDTRGNAKKRLQAIADGAKKRWQVENIAITHRIGKLKVGEFNLVVTVAAAHRTEGFAACQYIIDEFKKKLPTSKIETYTDGSVLGDTDGR